MRAGQSRDRPAISNVAGSEKRYGASVTVCVQQPQRIDKRLQGATGISPGRERRELLGTVIIAQRHFQATASSGDMPGSCFAAVYARSDTLGWVSLVRSAAPAWVRHFECGALESRPGGEVLRHDDS